MTRDDLPPPDPADPKIPVTPAGPVVPDGPLIPDGPAVPDGPAGCSVTAWLLQGTLLRKALLFYLAGLLAFGAYNYFKHPSLEKLVVGSDMEGYYQYLPWFFFMTGRISNSFHGPNLMEKAPPCRFLPVERLSCKPLSSWWPTASRWLPMRRLMVTAGFTFSRFFWRVSFMPPWGWCSWAEDCGAGSMTKPR